LSRYPWERAAVSRRLEALMSLVGALLLPPAELVAVVELELHYLLD
jgi:hypothetical protein